jgi:hypothetical protein
LTLRDVYEFYDRYFSYGKSLTLEDNRCIYLSIRDTMRVITKIIETSSFTPIEDYSLNKLRNPIALKYLLTIKKLMILECRDPLKELEFHNELIKIYKGELNSRRRGIKIPLIYWINNKKSKMILLSFSNSGNMIKELEVLKGLMMEFKTDNPFPKEIKKLTYWDLSSGKESSLDYISIKKVTKSNILVVANEI